MNQLKVFISYRRSDTQHVAGRLGDRIGTRFTLFMDIDDIPPGVDFTTVVRRAIDESDVLLVLIGPHFLGVGADGERRLDKSGDWVAEEVGTGLARDIAVVPVLVDGAQMPSVAELPGKLKGLAHRQALRLTHVSFNSDAERLIETLDDIERLKFGASDPPGRPAPPQSAPRDLFGDPDYSRAIAAAFNRRWEQAIELFEAVDQRFPDDDRVRGPLADARRGLHIEQLEAQAAEAERDGQWRAATASLEELATERPDDTDLLDRLERAKREARIEDLSGQLRAMFVAEEWVGVGVLSSQIAQIDPERADPEGLATAAAGNLVDRQLGERYANGAGRVRRGPIGRRAGGVRGHPGATARLPRGRRPRGHAASAAGDRHRGAAGARADRRPDPGPVPSAGPGASANADAQPGNDNGWPESPVDRDAAATNATRRQRADLAVAAGCRCAVRDDAGDVQLVRRHPAAAGCGAGRPRLLVALLVRDARRLDARRGRMLRISAIWAPVVGVGAQLVSVPWVDYLHYNGVDVNAMIVFWGSLIPVAVAVIVYFVMRRMVGRTAIWPALIVLVAALTTAVILFMALG